MSALQLHSPQAALTSVLSSLDIWSLVCAQMADGNDMVQALASYPTVQAAARQIGASTAAQAAAEAACEAGRGPVVPVVPLVSVPEEPTRLIHGAVLEVAEAVAVPEAADSSKQQQRYRRQRTAARGRGQQRAAVAVGVGPDHGAIPRTTSETNSKCTPLVVYSRPFVLTSTAT